MHENALQRSALQETSGICLTLTPFPSFQALCKTVSRATLPSKIAGSRRLGRAAFPLEDNFFLVDVAFLTGDKYRNGPEILIQHEFMTGRAVFLTSALSVWTADAVETESGNDKRQPQSPMAPKRINVGVGEFNAGVGEEHYTGREQENSSVVFDRVDSAKDELSNEHNRNHLAGFCKHLERVADELNGRIR
mmetsp:Transcript_33761/g.132695  ORF Transcript_33761/g.132695 Transcript_33761/m.132695 type:complete len:192 (-) Transcript_33761:963-1538(-)